MDESPTSQIDEQKINQIITIIRQEKENYLLTESQKKYFTLLTYLIYGFFILIVFTLIVVLIADSAKWSMPILILFSFAYIATPVLLSLNLPLFKKIRQQNKRIEKLGLKEILKKKRDLGTKKYRYIIMYILFIIASATVGLYFFPFYFGALLFPIAAVYLKQGRERLELIAELANLEDSLKSSQVRGLNEETTIKVPTGELEQVARIERGQIALNRDEAIDSFRKSASSGALGYALLKSSNVLTEIRKLDLELRLKVEEVIELLSSNPYPKESFKDSNGGNWHLQIPDTRFELTYVVDENQRQIQLIALRSKADQAALNRFAKDS